MLARSSPGFLVAAAILVLTRNVGASTFPVESDTLTVESGGSVACLDRSFILQSTLVIHEGERVLEDTVDYALDPDTGCFTLLTPDTLGAGRYLIASYQAMPMALSGTYQLQKDPHTRSLPRASVPTEASSPPPSFTSQGETEGLSISGSKTFGVEIGNNRDLKLRQSLDLRLVGKVGHDVSLLAILSDQDIPFQPEGNTAELSDLDRVLIQIKSPNAGASLGDVSMANSTMAFLNVQRELEGFAGDAAISGVRSRGALASAKGEFASVEIFGQDGKQGPYRLTDRTGNVNIVVVAGSERVWLDGRPLVRGAEEDYVVDYSLGEITFSTRHPISGNSQITIDYQYSTGRYERRISFAATEGQVGTVGGLQAAFFSEGDDPDDPIGGALTPSEREQLALLGDSAQVVSGGTGYVGPGLGDYQLVVDSITGMEIFVFVAGTGDYDVTFLNVGEGNGEYAPLAALVGGKVVFEFVGVAKGAFVPRRDLPSPQKKQLMDLRWDSRGKRGYLMAEGAVSNFDRNVLSPLDDEDNQGGALLAEGEIKELSLGSSANLTPRFRVRRVGQNFESPGRLRSGFYGREWNLTGTEPIKDESLQELGAELKWSDRFRWNLEGGHLALADSFSAVRQRQIVSYNDNWFLAQGSWTTVWDEVSGANGKLDRQGGELTIRRFKVQPRGSGFHEVRRRVSGTGERHRDLELALGFPLGAWPVRAEVGGGRRLDDSLQVVDDSWREVRESDRLFGSVEGRTRNLGFLLRYEARRVRGELAGNERQDTARLDLRHQAGRGAWNAVITSDVGTVGVRRRTKVIGPDSTGFYDQFGNYVGPGGGFDVQYGPPGEEVLAGSVVMSTRLRWSPPGADIRVPNWLRKFAWDGFINLNESSSLPLVQPRFFLDPGSYLNPETTIDGRLTTRQTVDLFPANRTAGLRLRQDIRRRMTQSPQIDETLLVEIQNENTYTATIRSNPAPGWDAELEGSLGSRGEEVTLEAGSSFKQETRIRAATTRGGRRFGVFTGRGRISADITYSRETGEDREAVGWVIGPRLQWSLVGTGRFDVRYSLTTLQSQRGFTGLRGPGAPVLTEGWRLDVISEIRVNQGIVVTGVFGIDKPKGFSQVNEGRMEVRGTF